MKVLILFFWPLSLAFCIVGGYALRDMPTQLWVGLWLVATGLLTNLGLAIMVARGAK